MNCRDTATPVDKPGDFRQVIRDDNVWGDVSQILQCSVRTLHVAHHTGMRSNVEADRLAKAGAWAEVSEGAAKRQKAATGQGTETACDTMQALPTVLLQALITTHSWVLHCHGGDMVAATVRVKNTSGKNLQAVQIITV